MKIVTRFLLYTWGRVRGEGGSVLKNVYGEALPQGPAPYPFIYRAVTQDFMPFW